MKSIATEFKGHRLLLTAEGEELTGCLWTDFASTRTPADCLPIRTENEILDMAVTQLSEYFAGRRCNFDLPFRIDGTYFQKRVWQELLKIPYGKTITYGELAARIGSPGAFRAVANACGANRIDVIIPCHRVVASGGKTGGYTGGLDIKLSLLELELNNFRKPCRPPVSAGEVVFH